jgi:hypothetical protein
MRTWPRLSGRRLQTLAVMPGKACSACPKASSVTGWTWYSRSAVATSGPERAKAPSWLGAIDIGPRRFSAYSSAMPALPRRVPDSSFSVFTPVDLVGAADLEVVLEVAAHVGAVVHHRQAHVAQQVARADARQLQERGGVDRAGRQDHLGPRPRHGGEAADVHGDAGGARPSNRTRSACAWVWTRRFGRFFAGRRKALAVFQRQPASG